MKKKLGIAIVILVIAGLLGSFVGQMTNVPVYVHDPMYRAMVGVERANPGFDILAMREHKNVIEVYLYPHKAELAVVDAFFDDLFLFVDELIDENIIEVRIFICREYNGRFYMSQLWRANSFADGLTIKAFSFDFQYQTIASMFPLALPVHPYYEGPPSIWK